MKKKNKRKKDKQEIKIENTRVHINPAITHNVNNDSISSISSSPSSFDRSLPAVSFTRRAGTRHTSKLLTAVVGSAEITLITR